MATRIYAFWIKTLTHPFGKVFLVVVLAKAAVLVVDMLKDFVKPEFIPRSRISGTIDAIKRLLDRARAKGVPVVYVCDSHLPDDGEFKIWPRHAVQGTEGAEVIEELKPREGDYIVKKRRYSGFYGTDLDLLLRELGVDTVIIVGVATHICVLHTAADAYFRGYRVFVPRDCVNAPTDEENDWGLRYIQRMYGAIVEESSRLEV